MATEIQLDGSDQRRLSAIDRLGMHLVANGKSAKDITDRLRGFIDEDFVPRFGGQPGVGIASSFDGYIARVFLEVPCFLNLENQTLHEATMLNDLSDALTTRVSLPLRAQQIRVSMTFSPIGEPTFTTLTQVGQLAALDQGAIFHGVYPEPATFKIPEIRD